MVTEFLEHFREARQVSTGWSAHAVARSRAGGVRSGGSARVWIPLPAAMP